MSLKSFGQKLARAFSGRGIGRGPHDQSYADLARRIEERTRFATMESHAYVDQRLAERAAPAEIGKRIEERALLASQEAKAYADSAVHSLSMGLRGMSKVVLRLQRRLEAMEAVQSDIETLNRRLMQVEQRLDAFRDKALEERIETLGTELGAFARRLDENGQTGQHVQRQIDRFDTTVRDLSAELVEMETALRDLDARFSEIAPPADAQRTRRSLRSPAPSDTARYRPAE